MNIQTAREVAARIWCDPDYSFVVMNAALAEAIAKMLLEEANWQESAAKLPSHRAEIALPLFAEAGR